MIQRCPEQFIIFVLKREVEDMCQICFDALQGDNCTQKEYQQLQDVKTKIQKRMALEGKVKQEEDEDGPRVKKHFVFPLLNSTSKA